MTNNYVLPGRNCILAKIHLPSFKVNDDEELIFDGNVEFPIDAGIIIKDPSGTEKKYSISDLELFECDKLFYHWVLLTVSNENVTIEILGENLIMIVKDLAANTNYLVKTYLQYDTDQYSYTDYESVVTFSDNNTIKIGTIDVDKDNGGEWITDEVMANIRTRLEYAASCMNLIQNTINKTINVTLYAYGANAGVLDSETHINLLAPDPSNSGAIGNALSFNVCVHEMLHTLFSAPEKLTIYPDDTLSSTMSWFTNYTGMVASAARYHTYPFENGANPVMAAINTYCTILLKNAKHPWQFILNTSPLDSIQI